MSRLTFRPVAKPNGEFADWLQGLGRISGCYVIRSSAGILYVGESHSGRLACTLKRHFWPWSDHPDRKHHTYQRGRCEAAIVPCPPGAATGLQERLIARLQPRDNAQSLPF